MRLNQNKSKKIFKIEKKNRNQKKNAKETPE